MFTVQDALVVPGRRDSNQSTNFLEILQTKSDFITSKPCYTNGERLQNWPFCKIYKLMAIP